MAKRRNPKAWPAAAAEPRLPPAKRPRRGSHFRSAESRAKAVANLKPWAKGRSGNPEGRPSAGASVKELINAMQELTAAEVEAVLTDPASSVRERTAARVWLHASSDAVTAGGTPVAGPDLDRILDYTDGRPTQAVKIEGKVRHAADVHAVMAAALGSPEAFAQLAALADDLLPGAAAGVPADPGEPGRTDAEQPPNDAPAGG